MGVDLGLELEDVEPPLQELERQMGELDLVELGFLVHPGGIGRWRKLEELQQDVTEESVLIRSILQESAQFLQKQLPQVGRRQGGRA